jgi:peptide/nickel transport system permease protein
MTRTALLDEWTKDYVRSARARGASSARLFWRHLARNASIPVITVAAIEISNLLAGAVIVETVFAWPGLGQVTVQSILARDFMVVQGVVLLGAIVTILLSLTADLLYSWVDPRIRLDGQTR